MSTSITTSRPLLRRQVLRLVGLTGLGIAAASCAAPAATPANAPPQPTAAPKPTAPLQPTARPAATTAPTAAPAAPTAAPKPSITAKPMTWRYGTFNPNLQDSPFLVGTAKGYFKDLGATIEPTFLNSSVIAMQGLTSGEFDFISLNFLGEIVLIAGGAPVKVLGSSAQRLNQFIAGKKSIASTKELEGKTIATQGPGSLSDILVDLALAEVGLKPDQVSKVNGGTNSQMFASLSQGMVDAAGLDWDNYPLVMKDPNLKSVVNLAEALPSFVTSGIVVPDKILKDNPNEVVALLAGTARSIRYIYDNPADVVKIMSPLIKRDETETSAALEQYLKNTMWPKNLELTGDQINYMQDLAIGLGRQSARTPLDKVADFTFREKAIAAVGRA